MTAQHDVNALAEQLTRATRAGSLNAAYSVIQNLPTETLQGVALKCGFACTSTKKRRDFLAHIVGQVAEATRRQTDGYGLREMRKAAP